LALLWPFTQYWQLVLNGAADMEVALFPEKPPFPKKMKTQFD
jgi:hypothetical protein